MKIEISAAVLKIYVWGFGAAGCEEALEATHRKCAAKCVSQLLAAVCNLDLLTLRKVSSNGRLYP